MSRGFVKEYEDQWLHEIDPTITALIRFLTIENNGIRVYEKKTYTSPSDHVEVHEMSNGLSYAVNVSGQWYMIEDVNL